METITSLINTKKNQMENKLQQAKDEIAKEYGTNYTNLINDSVETNDIIERIAIRYNELSNEELKTTEVGIKLDLDKFKANIDKFKHIL